MESVKDKAILAKSGFIVLSNAKTRDKNETLESMAKSLDKNRKKILEANKLDIIMAKKLLQKGELTDALVKRLEVTDSKIDEMILGIRDVIKLEDPVGKTISAIELDSGLELYQIAVPIGVIGMVFESRPDVIPQIMSLALKSGNGILLKGGKESLNTNKAIFEILRDSIKNKSIPKEAFQLL
ncbi:MAG TPA: gamma-glutamyl-phosphate reductase, partial [Methanofastidiosum sp.]|nr:gamma-glutamyl-phosphate reductase [Methanofastidiosum sp.]